MEEWNVKQPGVNAVSLLEMTHVWFIKISLCTCMEHVCWRHQAVCMTIRDMFNGYFTSAVLVMKLWWSETGFMNSLLSASKDLHVKPPGKTNWREGTRAGWISGGSRISSSRRGTNLSFAIIFCWKLHENAKIGLRGGRASLMPPRSATADIIDYILEKIKFTWS